MSLLPLKPFVYRSSGYIEDGFHDEQNRRQGQYFRGTDNGRIIEDSHYLDGERHGECRHYSTDNADYEIYMYDRGVRHGRCTVVRGPLVCRYSCSDGKVHGFLVVRNDSTGKTEREELFWRDMQVLNLKRFWFFRYPVMALSLLVFLPEWVHWSMLWLVLLFSVYLV